MQSQIFLTVTTWCWDVWRD